MLALFFSVGISSIFFVGSSKALDKGRVICPLFYAQLYSGSKTAEERLELFDLKTLL